VNRVVVTLLASLIDSPSTEPTTEPIKIRITTWNLEWFPNGSAHDATPEVQAQGIQAAADVIRPIDPDIILLQEIRDYEACARLGEAIAPGMYHVAICSAFKEPFQAGLDKRPKLSNKSPKTLRHAMGARAAGPLASSTG
jgi:hypothetical protein